MDTSLQIVLLKDLCVDGKGKYGIQASGVDFDESLYPFLRVSDITPDGRLDKSNMMSVLDPNAEKYLLSPNDIVFVREGGSTGKNYFYDGSDGALVFAGYLVKFSLDEKLVLPSYIKYYCQSDLFNTWVFSVSTGTTRDNINAKTFGNMEIVLPSRHIQEQIVTTLSVFDNKFGVNTKICENLYQQAKLLFNHFYSKAKDSVDFGELVHIGIGGTPKTNKQEYWNGEIPFFSPKDCCYPYTVVTSRLITQEGLEHCCSRLFPVNTVFISSRGTVGKVCLAGVPMAMNQSCYALEGIDIHQLLVYFYTLQVIESLKFKANGSIFDAISSSVILKEKVFKLADVEATYFVERVVPFFKQILNITLENQRLLAIKSKVITKYFSDLV